MKKVIFALAICASIVSCQKKEDTDPIDVSKTVYVMDKKWELKAYTWLPDINDSASFPVDEYTPLPGCQKNNYLIFNTINRVSEYEGDTKCNVNDPDSTVYGYILSNNDAHLQIYSNPDDVTHQIYFDGDVKYPSIDTFIVTYHGPNPADSNLISEYVKTYVKIQ